MFRCIFRVGAHGQLGKRPQSVLGSTYRIGVGLDTSLTPIHAISYLYTDSSRGILIYSRYPTELRWWLIHVGMSLWYVVRLNTYLDLRSETAVAPCQKNCSTLIGTSHMKKIASSHVSSHLPPNKAKSLMLRIDTCELPHTNSYVINQSYAFVFHLTSSLQPPNNQPRTECQRACPVQKWLHLGRL